MNIFIVPNLGFHWQARSFVYHSDEEEFPEKKLMITPAINLLIFLNLELIFA